MDNDHPAATPGAAVPGTPRKLKRESPFVRLGCFAAFVLTLPFAWGQTSSCNGPSRTFTGLEQATKDPKQALALGILFVTPVLLGFVQYFLRPHWIRVVMELISAVCSGLGTAYCFLAVVFSNFLSGKAAQIFPAPIVATIAAFLMTLHAFNGFVLRIAELVTTRRKDNRGR